MNSNSVVPVFYDPKFRRRRVFNRAAQFVAATLSVVFGVLIAGILINPVLPGLGLPSVKGFPQAHHVLSSEPVKADTVKSVRILSPAGKSPVKPSVLVRPSPRRAPGRTEVIGFYVNWDDTSFTSFKQNIDRIDTLVPEWLHLADETGTLVLDDAPKQKQVIDYVREHRPGLRIVPLVNNFNSPKMEWEAAKLQQMLADKQARARAVEGMLDYVRSNGFAGVSVDFENVPDAAQPALTEFMRELYGRFHPFGLEISESVPLDDPEFDYGELAKCNDYLILMAYDEHWSEGAAGPVASQSWYTQALEKRFAELPADKYVIAVGNYGYDWLDGKKNGTEISFQEAVTTARESEGVVRFDTKSLNPTFDYYDEKDLLHHVWFLDAVTTYNQLRAGGLFTPRGFALWRLGSEDPSVWPVFERRGTLDRSAARTLDVMRYGYDLDYKGRGEVLKVTSEPADGGRRIAFDDSTGLVADERLTSFPSPYVIWRWGGNDQKKIALTFDDGPDPTQTPRILDILKRYQAPATFFIIGVNADANPGLLKRIVDEGHEIGNHTFTHPNISVIADEQLSAEINATQRLLESAVGRRTVLFRPPYAEDVEPESPDQVRPLVTVGRQGYYAIGMGIDPDDWKNPGVDTIVREVLDQAEAGNGNIVLLHDAGGDRSQTVAALPRIIEELRAHGYELVSTSNLLGLNRDAVMPVVPPREKALAHVDGVGFMLIGWASSALKFLFACGIVLGILRLSAVAVLAVKQYRGRRRSADFPNGCPKVGVIVPAYNEEKVVCRTVASLLDSDHPNFEIVVVDDGSTDDTFGRVKTEFGDHAKVRVFRKENGGKASALNFGIAHTDAEIVAALDADTVFRPDTLRKLTRHFGDPRIGAVAGNAKVGNRINLMTRWQALEYVTSQNLDRRAFDVLNCISVVPGAVGAWRREPVERAGGFTNQTLAEDADLTMSVLRQGYRIVCEPEAEAFTEAPDTPGAFLKQRFRWMFGTLQAVWKHKDTLFRPSRGTLGFLALPNVLLFQVFFPLISPAMDLMMIGALVNAAWQRRQHPTDYSTDGLKRALFYYALFLAVDFVAALTAFLLERDEDWSLLAWLFPQRFFYRQLMYYTAIKSVLTAVRGGLVGWNKLERKATVAVVEN